MRALHWLLSTALCIASSAALAQSSPEDLVKSTTQEVLEIVKNDKEIQAGNNRKAASLIETRVVPYFDFQRMTALAVGKNWRQASATQQQELIREFRTLLVRTYSSAVTAYRNQTIDTKLLQQTEQDAVVRSTIKQSGGQPIPIDYNLNKTAQGWKVYDVSIDGVSLVTNYRSNFASEIQQGGVDGLIKHLSEKNRSEPSAVTKK